MESWMEEILRDYEKGREIDRRLPPGYPDGQKVGKLIGLLRRILFPGYFAGTADRREILSEGIVQLGRLLEPLAGQGTEAACRGFFGKLPRVRNLLQTDLEAAFRGDPAAGSREEILLTYPGMFAITVYRLAHVLYEKGIPLLPRMMTEIAHSLTGIDIHPGAAVGAYFMIDHGTGIVVGETARIGEGVKLYQGVTLGALSTRGGQRDRGMRRHPTIEDRVTLYAGASILGGDTVIGHDCVIGCNAFLTRSVPPGTTVPGTGES